MADLGTAQGTATGAAANLIRSYYDRVLLERVYQDTRYYQFGEKKPLPTNDGTSVTWNMPRSLGLGYTLSEGVPTSTGFTLSSVKVSALIRQFGGHVPISDLASLTTITDLGELATRELADQAALTIERVTYSELINHYTMVAGSSAHHMFKTSAEVTDYWGQISAVSTTVYTVSSTNVIAVSDIRAAVKVLRAQGAKPYDEKNNMFIAIMDVQTADDIKGDSTWINWHQYAGNGMAVEGLYKGEIGSVYGARVVETNNGPICRGSNAGGTASTMAYGTAVFGTGFFGVTELDGGIKTMIATGSDKRDPLNQMTVYGWKANFIAKMLNTSAGVFIWTGSGDTTAACAESASSGLRQETPTSY